MSRGPRCRIREGAGLVMKFPHIDGLFSPPRGHADHSCELPSLPADYTYVVASEVYQPG
jgi:hypothetical protein